ncbi:hypothetical protein Tco_1222295 [Tanacetum coccineum]
MMRVTTSFLQGSWTKAKLQERRLPEPTEVGEKAGQVHPPHKNNKRNFGFTQRKVQTSSAIDNPGKLRRCLKQETVTFNQRTKAKQWERPGKDNKKGGNLRKGQAVGNPDGTAMAEGSQIKDYPNLLSRDNDLIPTPRGGGWDGGSYDYRS